MSAAPAIARLFVGLPLPRPLAGRLAEMQPKARQGVRLIAESDLHLTLHFLGTREVAPTREALASVRASAFPVRLEGPGCFSAGRKTILWVGVEPSGALIELHRVTGEALRAIGFEPERRRYHPHVTLARLAPRTPRRLVDAFVNDWPETGGLGFECSRFALFESRTDPEGARYRVLDSFGLGAVARAPG